MAYRSQFMDRYNRAHHAQCRIRRKLCERGNFDPDEWDLPPKPKGMRQRTYEGIEAKYDHYEAILRHNHIWPPAAAMHRREAVVEAGGWPERHGYFEDVALYLQLARRHPIRCHPDIVCDYRRQPEGASNNRAAMLDGIAAVLREQEAYVQANPRYATALAEGRRAYMARWGGFLADAVREQWHARDWRRMATGLATLARHHPRGLAGVIGRKLRSLAGGRTQ